MTTIKDISKACGGSPATVSKALNGYPEISAETVELVRRTAREMRYMPDAAARSLKTKTTHNIGVLFMDGTRSGLTHEYFSLILNSVKAEAEVRGEAAAQGKSAAQAEAEAQEETEATVQA